jgi:hypothetical protein
MACKHGLGYIYRINLKKAESEALERIAKSFDMKPAALARDWVEERIAEHLLRKRGGL